MGNEVAKSVMQTGTVTGTGASIIIQCGFQPRHVEIVNITGDCNGKLNDTLADGEIYKILTTSGAHALMATLGITPYAGTVGANNEGFIIGADTDLNVTAQTIMWTAWR